MISGMLLRALVVTVLGLSLALPSGAAAKRKVRRRAPASQPALVVRQGSLDAATEAANADEVVPTADAAGAPPVEGAYSGVRPGTTGVPPRGPKAGGAPFLTWTGFMMTESGSRVFLQLTQQVPFAVTRGVSEVVITLKGCRLYRRNNGRPVNTSFFATPVTSIQARQHGAEVRVRLGLRATTAVAPRFEAGEAGYQLLVIDFAPEQPARQPAAR
jgi:hypothetical protein